MNFLAKLLPSRKEAWLHETTLSIVDHCWDAVWSRVEARIFSLSPAQARGYVRARSIHVVHRHLQTACCVPAGVSSSVQKELTRRVHEELVGSVLSDVSRRRTLGQLRRAA